MGRILLAALPDEQLEQYLATAEFAPLTPWTVTNPKALRELITKVRRDGYIIVRDELEEGLAAVAVPVRLKSGRTVAALNRSEEHTSELQSLMRISYAVFCLKKKKKQEIMRLHPQTYSQYT